MIAFFRFTARAPMMPLAPPLVKGGPSPQASRLWRRPLYFGEPGSPLLSLSNDPKTAEPLPLAAFRAFHLSDLQRRSP
jgi:hypothetical protein